MVICPGCKVPMGVRVVVQGGPGAPSGKIAYKCIICKTETERLFRDSGASPAVKPSDPSASKPLS